MEIIARALLVAQVHASNPSHAIIVGFLVMLVMWVSMSMMLLGICNGWRIELMLFL